MTQFKKFHSKPMVYEAIKLTSENAKDVATEVAGMVAQEDDGREYILVPTLNGAMPVNVGEYLYVDEHGAYRAAPAVAFEKTFELGE